MSDSSRVQVERYMNSMWDDMRNDIAADRKIDAEDLNVIADSMKIKRAEDAVEFKLLDGVKYSDEVMALLMKKVGVDSEEDLELQNFEKYAKKSFYEDQLLTKSENPGVAVILAEGDVATEGEGLTSAEICKLFKKVRNEKSIKVVVFRINSPGGSALASEEIWREVNLTNKVKKVVVSMGDVAASGGYYIASPAYKIFAEPTTITGSIGVFGMIPYTGKMLENKLGISFDRVSTNQHAVLSTNRKLTPMELAITQEEVDEIWLTFSDPQAKKPNKRLTALPFIARYRKLLKKGGRIHLKTDSDILFEFTEEEIREHGYQQHELTWDLYGSMPHELDPTIREILHIKTHYEQLFTAKGSVIKYCRFRINDSLEN
jgi:protease-4